MRATTRSLLLLAAAPLIAPPCVAQGNVEITPFAGLYPQTALFNYSTSSPACLVPPGVSCSITAALDQNDAVAVGGRLTSWVGERVALDLSLAHWGSNLGGGVSDITTGSFGVLYNLTSPDSAGFFVLGGVSFVALGGSAYNTGYLGSYTIAPSQTDWGPVLGVGARIPFSHAVGLRVQVEDHLYWLTDVGGSASNSSIEHALVFSVGPSVRLGRRPRDNSSTSSSNGDTTLNP
jgi:hypothetical protein